MRAFKGRKKELSDRKMQIEEVAGISLLKYSGKIDWDHFRQSQNDLAAANPEYRAITDELRALVDKEYAQREERRKRANKLRYPLSEILHIEGLTDEQKVSLLCAVELMWSCKDGVVVRAEKLAKKNAAKNVPSFRPSSWQSKRKPKAVGA